MSWLTIKVCCCYCSSSFLEHFFRILFAYWLVCKYNRVCLFVCVCIYLCASFVPCWNRKCSWIKLNLIRMRLCCLVFSDNLLGFCQNKLPLLLLLLCRFWLLLVNIIRSVLVQCLFFSLLESINSKLHGKRSNVCAIHFDWLVLFCFVLFHINMFSSFIKGNQYFCF